MGPSKHKQTGFTIVELLVVIVVIGILAAIVIIAYNGIQARARTAVMQADLSNSNKQLALYVNGNNATGVAGYPAAIDCSASPAANTICLKASDPSTTLAYSYNSAANTFCLSEKNNGTIYHVSSTDTTPTLGVCPLVWSTVAATGNQNWRAIAMSGNGQVIAAATTAGNMVLSTNGGATWVTKSVGSTSDNLLRIAVSNDGTKILTTDYFGTAYLSTNSGTTWTNLGSAIGYNTYLGGVAMSADGTKMAVATYGNIFLSSNSGASWGLGQAGSGYIPTNKRWSAIAISGDGSVVYAMNLDDSGKLYKTTNFGTSTWTQTNAGLGAINLFATNTTGSKLLAVNSGGGSGLNMSVNGGATWTGPIGYKSWGGVAMSSDGSKMIATTQNEYVYASTDGGTTWNVDNSLGVKQFNSIATTSDGNTNFTGVYGGIGYKATY